MYSVTAINKRPLSLLDLQSLAKRDPESYKEESLHQWQRYVKLFDLLCLDPENEDKEYIEMLRFVSDVAHCYPEIGSVLPRSLVLSIKENFGVLHPEIRTSIVKALMVIRSHKLISDKEAVPLLLDLLRCKDRNLGRLICGHIIQGVKVACSNNRNQAYSSYLRGQLCKVLGDENESSSVKALELIISICVKGIWRDTTTVNIIAGCCFSAVHKLSLTALHFFLGKGRDQNEDDNENSNNNNMEVIMSIKHSMKVGKHTEQKEKTLKRLISKSKNQKKTRDNLVSYVIHLINNPYDFAERLFLRAKRATSLVPFETRLLCLDLATRVMQTHKLIIVPFYEYVLPYLRPSQRDVSSLLAFTVRACHDLVPPNLVTAILRSIADGFVWNNVSTEIVTSGLNAMREMCVRCPLAMPDDLLDSLIEDYKSHKDRPAREAARSLLNLYRNINPAVLRKKNRGKEGSMRSNAIRLPTYGQQKIFTTLEGFGDVSALSGDLPAANIDFLNTEYPSSIDESDSFEVGEMVCDERLQLSGKSRQSPPETRVDLPNPSSEILTNEQFSILKTGKCIDTRKHDNSDTSNDSDSNNIVTAKDIIGCGIRTKDYDSRMKSVLLGREGRVYRSGKSLRPHKGSTSNKVKAKKNKNLAMKISGKKTQRKFKSKSLIKKSKNFAGKKKR